MLKFLFHIHNCWVGILLQRFASCFHQQVVRDVSKIQHPCDCFWAQEIWCLHQHLLLDLFLSVDFRFFTVQDNSHARQGGSHPDWCVSFAAWKCLVYTGILSPIIGGCILLLAAWLISDVTLFLVYSSGTFAEKVCWSYLTGRLDLLTRVIAVALWVLAEGLEKSNLAAAVTMIKSTKLSRISRPEFVDVVILLRSDTKKMLWNDSMWSMQNLTLSSSTWTFQLRRSWRTEIESLGGTGCVAANWRTGIYLVVFVSSFDYMLS